MVARVNVEFRTVDKVILDSLVKCTWSLSGASRIEQKEVYDESGPLLRWTRIADA
jgi:hypothetical protein